MWQVTYIHVLELDVDLQAHGQTGKRQNVRTLCVQSAAHAYLT